MSDSSSLDSQQLQKLKIHQYFKSIHPDDWSFNRFRSFGDNGKLKLKNAKQVYHNSLLTIKSERQTSSSLKSLIGYLLERLDQECISEPNTINITDTGQVNINSNLYYNNERNEGPQPPSRQQQDNRKRKHVETEQSSGNDNDTLHVSNDLERNEKVSWESSDYHPRRKSKVNYLTGNYDHATCSSSGESWMINGRNMVEFLTNYRNTSVTGANKRKNLSDARILCLSFIFLFKIHYESSCTHHLPLAQHVDIMNSINIKQHWKPLFLDAGAWCLRLGQQLKSSPSMELNTGAAKLAAMRLCMEDWRDDEQGPMKRLMADTLLSIICKFEHWTTNCVLETTFISQRLMPFMECVFENDKSFCGKQGESFVSRNGDDLENGILMADYTISYRTCFAEEFDLFVVEVKPPGKSSSGQLQSDLIKLGKEMKRMVDCLVDAGVDNIVVGGMLVQGVSCETYMMDLKFDGIYRMTQLAEFHLLRGPNDLMLVPEIIEYLLQIKTMLHQTISNINSVVDKRILKTSSDDNICAGTPKSWKRKACGLPEKIR